jgi:predicted kinase
MNLKYLKEPFVIILIGPPLSGKSTWIRENFPTTEVISRDEIVMEVYGSKNYTEAFKSVDQKEVDKVLAQRFLDANKEKKNVIVDMTHMASKRRKQNLNYFTDDYYKLGVIFPILSDDEYERRNQKRIEEENKDLPMGIVKSMISSYQPVMIDEGFNKLITLK